MLTKKFTDEQVQAVVKFITEHQHFVILTHTSPDGDALGSSLGMGHYLRTLGKEVQCMVPNSFPDFLAWLPGIADEINYEEQTSQALGRLATADAVICTDFNELKRINALGQQVLALRAAKDLPVLMIDHHLLPENDTPVADILLSHPESPSASELVYRLIADIQPFLHGTITQEAATCLYCGMMTDTGNFSFNSNYPDMYEIVGELVRLGVNKDEVYNNVFNQYSVGRLKLMGYCLYHKMRLFPAYHVALITISGKELYRFQFKSGDAEGLVNLPLKISDIYYSCFMREDKIAEHERAQAKGAKKKIKISFRSQGNRPVNIFARDIFNGGGHLNAAGGEYYGSLENAVQLFLDHYPQYLSKD